MLQKNQTLLLSCQGLGADFEGICRHEGQVVFVPGALPGEQVRVKIIKVQKRHALGRLEEILSPSPQRATPPCPYFPRCGGCTAQHMAYEETLRYKREQVRDCLVRIGGFESPDVREVLGMPAPLRYRNKGAFPVGGEASAPRIGCYAARSHTIVDAPRGCLLQTEQSDALVAAVRAWMAACHVPPYDEAAHRGLVRHIVTREAKDGGMLLVLVLNGQSVPGADALIEKARSAAPSLRGIALSENTRRTNVILGNAPRVLWGEGYLLDELAGCTLRVSPHTFFQVNRPQAEVLYRHALGFCALTGNETVWDLYCGCGSITLPLSKRARRVTGVEVVEAAVQDARENAWENGIAQAEFIAGATEAVLPALWRAQGTPDVVVMDPPRKGCDPAALRALSEIGPPRIVYVSCNPATLARDAALLRDAGYGLGPVQPVDMFPWTGHVEAVTWLAKQ